MKGFFKNLRGDAFGGLTAGIVALPLALAFGVSSGLGPSAGLYGAIFISFFAALFGGTNTQISGPTAPMTAVSMLVIAGLIGANNGDVEKALPAILTIFLLAGLMQIGLGAIGIGKYIRYIPYPVVSGFMTAIGVMILITQFLPALGYYPKEDEAFVEKFKPQSEEVILDKILKQEAGEGILVLEDFKETIRRAEKITEEEIHLEAVALAGSEASGVLGSLKSLPRALSNINYLELILCLTTIVIIYGFKRITTAVPSTLVSLLIVSGVAFGFGLDYRPIEKIPSGFPEINFSIFSNFSLGAITPYFFTALSLSFLGAIDSLLTSVVADNMTKTKHNPNKELVGQGIGNSIAAVFGGIPGAGATIRTVVNINAGGKTKLSGMIAGVLLLIILLALGPVASQIPAAVLAGILITVGIGVMDYKGLKAIPSMPWVEVAIMLIVLFLSVFWDLVYAVGIGLVLASLMFMKKMGDVTARESKVESLSGAENNNKEKLWKDEISFPKELKEEIFIKHLNGPVFFGATSELQQLANQIPETATHVILRMDRVPYMDQSGVYTLEEIILGLEQRRIKTHIVGIQRQPLYLVKNIDIIPDLIPEDFVFDNFDDCISYLKEVVEDTV
ncbi:SulP family inorganic anion transporter [Aquimarina sp. MMG016]|uniref:SulP family inorganic anion transporter n=1 Tax=Aquimarina sp. MMG016 TaxID=2822690 RepID=UPI001B39EBC7|nr:SulP family inorganic anion transporter [Aquimarina sp. MMG016]MBQ4820187.1 SulP family inorganic anion transporter [Aquimarina sp. MMG016]